MSHAEYCGKFIPSGGVILDVGSGNGKFLVEMIKLGFKSYGVEANINYIEEAKKNHAELNIVKARAEALPFSEGFFDFVNCSEVTEHVDYPEKICREIFRVLKSGGKCYISFHNRFGIYDYHYHLYFINWIPRNLAERILSFLGKAKNDGIAGRQKLATMHYYTYISVMRLLESAGFSVKDIRIEKIKLRFGILSPLALVVYFFLLRPFYFNTFHFLLIKPAA